MNQRRPNILLLFPDQLRHDWLQGTPGVPIRTPHVARLMQAGTRFTHAICPSPLCAPCRGCLASGREYHRAPVVSNEVSYPPGRTTCYRLLRDAGYYVMGCGKFDLHKPEYTWGSDGQHGLAEWGFSAGIDNEGKIDGLISGRKRPAGPYLRYLEEQGQRTNYIEDFQRRRQDKLASFPTPLSDEHYCDNWISRNGLGLLADTPADKLWFLQVNFTGPHNPWDVTESMSEWYREVRFAAPQDPGSIDLEAGNAVRRNYAAMVENIDGWVGRYLEVLRRREELDQTLVVFASDHGELLGDHGWFGKCRPHQASVGVPLVVAGPGLRRGVTTAQPATILDLAATFLDLAGVAVPADYDSRSLLPALEKGDAVRTHVTSALADGDHHWRLVCDRGHKLVVYGDGAHQVFALDERAAEREVAGDAAIPVRERLAPHLPPDRASRAAGRS